MAFEAIHLPFADAAVPDGLAIGPLAGLRERGLSAYRTLGMPNHRVEAWKWTRLKALEDKDFRTAVPADGEAAVTVPPLLGDNGRCARLVFVNGRPRADLSDIDGLPDGVRLTSLSALAVEEASWLGERIGSIVEDGPDGLHALNDAAFNDGWVLSVGRGIAIEKPIEIVSVGHADADPIAWFPRNLIVIEENAEVTLLVHQTASGAEDCFVNAVTEAVVADNARLRIYGVNAEGTGGTLVSRLHARLGRGASLETFVLDEGDGLTRNESVVLLEGEGAEARLDGGYLLRGSAHADNTTRIEHRVPNTACNEVFKGVVDDTARAVFQGKIVVCKDAQHTDGQMLNKTLLLSDKAEVDTKPELEIYADDVKCAHGATSGRIDEAALFYLRSRGIPEAVARNLLVRSFIGEATDRIGNETVRDLIAKRIEDWLPESDMIVGEQAA